MSLYASTKIINKLRHSQYQAKLMVEISYNFQFDTMSLTYITTRDKEQFYLWWQFASRGRGSIFSSTLPLAIENGWVSDKIKIPTYIAITLIFVQIALALFFGKNFSAAEAIVSVIAICSVWTAQSILLIYCRIAFLVYFPFSVIVTIALLASCGIMM